MAIKITNSRRKRAQRVITAMFVKSTV